MGKERRNRETIAEGGHALTKDHVKRIRTEELTLLESVLRLQGEFRRSLETLQVTPLQAGVILFLRRHEDGRVRDLADAFWLKLPTVVEVVNNLVGKRWVTKRGSVEDRRAVCLRLSRQGQALARKIEARVGRLSARVVVSRQFKDESVAKGRAQ